MLLFFGVYFNVHANHLDWHDKAFKYYAKEEPLDDVIQHFAGEYGASAVVSQRVTGKVSARFNEENPEAFLAYIAKLYNLVWFYDGTVLYVYSASEVQSTLLQLNYVTVNKLKSTLKEIGVWDDRYPWKELNGSSSVYLSGSPRYIQLVKEIADILERGVNYSIGSDNEYSIEIIPLKHAKATDRTITYRDQELIIPGIATILNNLLVGFTGEIGEAKSIRANKETQVYRAEDSLISNLEESRHLSAINTIAMVQAEPGINAIVVRDVKSKLPLYHKLIEKLDVPQIQIEIALSIVDLSANNLAQLGIDWSGNIDLGGNNFIDIHSTGSYRNQGKMPILTSGAELQAVMDKTNLNFLLAQVNLLQTKGSAQVVSKPILLTKENMQAVISTTETYHVKLIGTDTQSMAEIRSGLVFKVEPRVVQRDNSNNSDIYLDISIEDGSTIPSMNVGELPTTIKNEISTQARVKQNQGLLIGGLYRDEISQTLRKVPLLGDIPLIGNLFKSTNNRKKKTVRLFVIEPRIVTQSLMNDFKLEKSKDMKLLLEQTEDFSNNSTQLRNVFNLYHCKTLTKAINMQKALLDEGIGSFRESCTLNNGQSGFLVKTGYCKDTDTSCMKPKDPEFDYVDVL